MMLDSFGGPMTRKFVSIFFVLFFISGAAFSQRGRAKDLAGEFFGQEAFNRSLKFVAGTYAPEILLTRTPESDCVPPEILNETCFPIADASVVTEQALTNVTHIVIPGKSLHDVLLLEARNMYWTYLRSDMSSPELGLFFYQPTVTIRSKALAKPITANVGHHRTQRWVLPEEGWEGGGEDAQYTREYRLTRTLMKDGMGLTDAQINAFFDNDITIELNFTVRVKDYDAVDAIYDLMIYGS
jgi:hypothetical protein